MSNPKPEIPEDLSKLLSAADTRHGFPAGTMLAVMRKEIGGQFDRFLKDPSAYHYQPDAKGRRVAPHTGKVSTAFGPFGILESTAADPGYGVVKLADKTLTEQVRFAAEYLAARSKAAGGFLQGLAKYGEGDKYANQVAAFIDGAREGMPRKKEEVVAPTVAVPSSPAAGAAELGKVPVALPPSLVQYLTSRAVRNGGQTREQGNAWLSFLTAMQGAGKTGVGGTGAVVAPAIKPEELNFLPVGGGFQAPRPIQQTRIDFSPFTGFSSQTRKARL